MKKGSFFSGQGGVLKTIGRTIIILGIIFAIVWTAIGMADMNKAATAERDILYNRAYAEQQVVEYKKWVSDYEKQQADPDKVAEEDRLAEPPASAEQVEVKNKPVVKKSNDNYIGNFNLKYGLPALFVLVGTLAVGLVLCSHDKFFGWLFEGTLLMKLGRIVMVLCIIAAVVVIGVGRVELYRDATAAHTEEYNARYAMQQNTEFTKLQAAAAADETASVVPADASEIVTAISPIDLPLNIYDGFYTTGYFNWAVVLLVAGIGLYWIILGADDNGLKGVGRLLIVTGLVIALVWTGIGQIEKNQAAFDEREMLYERAYVEQQEKDYKKLDSAAKAAARKGEEPPYVPASASELTLEKPPKVLVEDDNYSGTYILNYALPAYVVMGLLVVLGFVLCNTDKVTAWFAQGGVMKKIGRTLTVLGVIVAIVFAAMGVVNMYEDATEAQQLKYYKKYIKQQDKEFTALEKAARAAEKAGEPAPDMPEDASGIVTAVEPVELSLDDHITGFITGCFFHALIALVAGIGSGWIVSNVVDWFKALVKAGPRRVIAGVCFWIGALVAVYFLAIGLIRILQIEKSTLPAVGEILMSEYVIWSVVALGIGVALRWMILKLPSTVNDTFGSVGSKLRFSGRALFVLTLVAVPVMLILAATMLITGKWMMGAAMILGTVVVFACGWVGSLVLDSLGTSTMIMEPQAQAAEAREHARRNASTWVCENCGTVNPRSAVTCSECGDTKPVQH